MKKLKHILILLPLAGTTLLLYGGIKSKPCVRKIENTKLVINEGIPDLIKFTNYFNP